MTKRNKIHKYLAERDGLVCWICGIPIEEKMLMVRCSELGNNSLAASRDHVIPVSKGGGNARSNLRLAHCSCNTRRADRELTPEITAWCRKTVERINRERKKK
jgi:5-methylcytosine-specific restriction endonuclease McrA